jgi:Zn-dependent protease with chaperone function
MENDEIIARLERIELQLVKLNREVIQAVLSAKSAHHRIDDLKHDICWTLGISITIVGIFASLLTTILQRL